jgi:hypothetical protein
LDFLESRAGRRVEIRSYPLRFPRGSFYQTYTLQPMTWTTPPPGSLAGRAGATRINAGFAAGVTFGRAA